MRSWNPRWRGPAATIAALACVLVTCDRATAGAPAAPDVVITQIVPLPNATPSVGGTISVEVTLLNQGTAAATDAFAVDLYRNFGTRPIPSSVPTDTLPATVPIAVDATTTVTFTGITSSVEETWKMWAYADRLNTLAESVPGENNNVLGPVTVTWGAGSLLPDLTITAITPETATPTPGTPVWVDVTVSNDGTAPSGLFRLDLFTNPVAPPVVGDQATDPAPLAGLSLAAGTSQNFRFLNVVSAVDAAWQMYAVVDTVGAVAESNELNNVFGPEALIWGTAASLMLDSPNGAEVWEVGTVHDIVWTSIGAVGADVKLEYCTDGGAGIWTEISASTPNDGIFGWIVPDDQSTQCLVRVSSTTTAYEDTSAGVFTIETPAEPKPDLRIVSIVPTDPSPTVGGSIDVTVTVLNQGTADADLFTVDLFKNRASPPNVGESGELWKSVTSLGAGLSTPVTFTGLTSASAVTWNMYAIVDTGDSIAEGNEDNNVAGPAVVDWVGTVGSITVTSPNGLEVLEAGTVHEITWTSTGDPGSAFHIEYSINSGSSWSVVVNMTFNTSHFWTVPAEASTTCLVLVSNMAATVTDQSDDFFEIHTTPDLIVASVAPSDAHPVAGDAISVDVTVENVGTADAGPFVVALFENPIAPPAVGDPATRSLPVASLAAGASTVVTFSGVTSGSAGTWAVYAAADNDDDVPDELSEANNVSGASTVQWHARPWLGAGCSAGGRSTGAEGALATALLALLAAALLRLRRGGCWRD